MTGVLKAKVNGVWTPITPSPPPQRIGCSWKRVAVQTLPNQVVTAIVWDTMVDDTHGFGTAGSATITIPPGCGGIYTISGSVWVGTDPMKGEAEIAIIGVMAAQAVPSARTGWAVVNLTHDLGEGQPITLSGWQATGTDFASAVANVQLYRTGPGITSAVTRRDLLEGRDRIDTQPADETPAPRKKA
jgi:hypothetical protein